MENKKIKKDIEIEKYFDGELSPREVKNFEHKMAEDPVFGRDVETHGRIRESLKEIERRSNFYINLENFHKELEVVSDLNEEELLEVGAGVQQSGDVASKKFSLRSRLMIESGIIAAGVAIIICLVFFPFSKENNGHQQEVGTHSEVINKLDTIKRTYHEKQAQSEEAVEVGSISPTGTAVAVSVNGYFVVNSADITGGKQRLNGVLKDKKVSYTFEVIANDKNIGLSLIHISDTTFNGFPLNLPFVFAKKDVKMAEDVMLLGIPGDDITFHKGYVKSTGMRNNDSKKFLLALNDREVSRGSVVLNRKGEVIGIINANVGEGRNLKISAIQTQYITSFLRSCKEKHDLNELMVPYKNYLFGYNDIRIVEKVSPYLFSID